MSREFDVIVVGAGVNGTGIARDLALRGIKTLLLDKRDISSGATGACSGMIHGGLRYLLFDINTTRHSCLDSGYIQKIAPHLLFRIPFIMPISLPFAAPFFETYFEVYDKYAPLKRGKSHTMLDATQVRALLPGISKRVRKALTTDEWGIDPQRLCIANALCAHEHGARVRLYTEVIEFLRDHEKNIIGVRTRDRFGKTEEFRARIIMHATGPWLTKTSSLAGVDVKIRPGKGVHLVFDRRLFNYCLILNMVDGRGSFIMPHENTSILGTTDDDYYGDPDDLRVTEDEIEYLLQGAERYLPEIRKARVIRTYAGIRPTLFQYGRNEDALTRDHMVYDHERTEGVKGIVSIAGGKLASYRLMSEDAADLIAKKLGVDANCTTHIVPLPGGEEQLDPDVLAREYNLGAYAMKRLIYRHGARAREILELTRERPELRRTVCRCEPVIAAELVYCIRKEWAVTLTGLRNRTRMGTGPCQGSRCAMKAIAVLAEELDLSGKEAQQELMAFLERRWRGKRPVLMGSSLDQEELNQAAYFGVANLRELVEG
jgi:glycerol-3-phosphate dehydrogenase